jgi:AcrR family transcriptional regulator
MMSQVEGASVNNTEGASVYQGVFQDEMREDQPMSTTTTPTSTSPDPAAAAEHKAKALRADAQRNRDALLEAAAAAFTERGTDTSLEDVAKRAGVGIGTLYRHFPTREALVEAAYRRGVEAMCDQAGELLGTHRPAVALELWLTTFVGYVATKRGLASTLKQAADGNADLFAHVHNRLRTTMETLVTAAADSGEIRADVSPADLLRAIGGVCMVSDQPNWQEQAHRLVALLMDGLRYGAPNAS